MTQVPPTRYSSAIITRAPWRAAIRAARTPPDPAPITNRSTLLSGMLVRFVGGWLSDHANPLGARQNGGLRQPDEQSVLDHAGDADEPIGKRARIGDLPERRIENPMTAIGDERQATRGLAQQRRPRAMGGRGGRLDRRPGGRQTEGHH